LLFLVDQGVRPRIASYDRRLRSAAESVGIEVYPLRCIHCRPRGRPLHAPL
jgi:hypothetical protein